MSERIKRLAVPRCPGLCEHPQSASAELHELPRSSFGIGKMLETASEKVCCRLRHQLVLLDDRTGLVVSIHGGPTRHADARRWLSPIWLKSVRTSADPGRSPRVSSSAGGRIGV